VGQREFWISEEYDIPRVIVLRHKAQLTFGGIDAHRSRWLKPARDSYIEMAGDLSE
jgi:hypothetical protein